MADVSRARPRLRQRPRTGGARLGAGVRLPVRARPPSRRRGPAEPAGARSRREGLPRGTLWSLHAALRRGGPRTEVPTPRDHSPRHLHTTRIVFTQATTIVRAV